MSGEPNRDQPDSNEDDFILEDAPVNDLEDLFRPGPAAAAPPGAGKGDEPSDVLFQDAAQQAEAAEQFEGRPEFAENSDARWGGHKLQPGEIGIPVEGGEDPLTAEDSIDADQELQVVDDERELEASASPGEGEAFALDEQQDAAPAEHEPVAEEAEAASGNPFLTGQERHEFPVEDGWEPIEATPGRVAGDPQDLQTVDEAAAAAETSAEAEAESPEFAEVAAGDAELYGESVEPPARTVGAPSRRNRMLMLLPSVAAAVLVLGAGAVVVLRPEWFGLHFRPQLVERVQVARPNIEVRVPAPPMPVAAATADPGVAPTPVVPSGTPDMPPVTPVLPPNGEQPRHPAPPPQVGRAAPPADPSKLLPVGDTMWIGDLAAREQRGTPWLDVRLGAKAFAQLHNGNFFVGSVKAVAADVLVLKVGTGEVTLSRAEVDKVTPLDSEEYQELQRATTGVLRLSNKNRLVGTILKSVADDNYVLQMRSDRIVVPKSSVDTFVEQNGDRLKFGTGQDEEAWLREMAARQLRAAATGDSSLTGFESHTPARAPTPAKPAPAKPTPAPPPKASAPPRTAPIRPAVGQKK